MCVVLVPNIGLRTTISNTTQICPLHFRNFMRVHWECAWCQCQILVLEPPYPTLHKYAHSTSETSCVSTDNLRGASSKYWSQNHHIQLYTNMPTALQKLHVCPLTMCVVLVPNIGLRTTISNTTQICPQHFGNFMCVHGECEWCQCQILVLEPPYPTLHKYAHSTSETSCVSTGNVRGASAKHWSQNRHIQHYTNTPTALQKHYTNTPTVLQKLHVSPLTMCMVLVSNIGLRTTISIILTVQKYAYSTSETSCVSTGNVRGASAKHWSQNHHIQHYTNMPTALQKLHACPLGMCVVLVPNFGLRTTISNTTQIRPQYFRNFMRVHWECAWCQCQILVLEPPYPTLHKYAHSTSETLHKYAHSTSETSCVSTDNVHGASFKYWSQNHHIQLYTNICPQHFRIFMCVH